MKRATQAIGRALLGALAVWLMLTASWSQTITWLGMLPDYTLSKAYGVSADGRVAVGGAYAAGYWRAFRWEDGVMQDLGTLGGVESLAFGASADG
jgi:probable HAF family extracellular repeat protein